MKRVLSTRQILAQLEAAGVKRARIAEALDLPPPRVTEMYKGERRLYHDEAVKLCEAFNLDERPEPLTVPVAKMLVLHAMNQLGHRLDPNSDRVLDLAQDFRAFAEFAADPSAEVSESALDAFLRGRLSGNRLRSKVA